MMESRLPVKRLRRKTWSWIRIKRLPKLLKLRVELSIGSELRMLRRARARECVKCLRREILYRLL